MDVIQNRVILSSNTLWSIFSFQLGPVDWFHFKPIKIVDDEIYYDFQLTTTESVIVGADREEVIEKIQRGFENQYQLYGKLKREDVKAIDYETIQAWKRIQRHIIYDDKVKSQ